MKSLAASLIAALLIQLPAQACELHKPDVIQAGQHFLVLNQQVAEVGALFNETKAAYDSVIYDVDENGGYAGWEDEVEALVQDMNAYNAEFEIAYRLLAEADAELKSALAAHESACGAQAQSAAVLAELGINENP